MNVINRQWMMRGAAQLAALRKGGEAVAAIFFAFCDSFLRLPPHLLEAVFLGPAGARTVVRVTTACENADLVKYENLI